MIKSDYSALIYKNPNVIEKEDENYKSLFVSSDVKCGELLLLEHVYAAKSNVCHLVIEHNSQLFNLYHPRIELHSDSNDIVTAAGNKLAHNCFGLSNGNKLITIYIQQINHSCCANTAVFIQENYTIEETNIIFMELYAIKNIKAGEEITLNYGVETAHKRDFECTCGLEEGERWKIFNITSNIVKSISSNNNKNIQKIIYEYLKELSSKQILLNQYLSNNGIFMNNNTIAGYTKDGIILINNLVHQYMNIKEPLISSSGKLVESEINAAKINLFLQIINSTILKN